MEIEQENVKRGDGTVTGASLSSLPFQFPSRERTYLSVGSSTTCISHGELQSLLKQLLRDLGEQSRVLLIPPDHTRSHSRAGLVADAIFKHYGAALTEILPALGTHKSMTADNLDAMYPGIPHELFHEHRWREDVVTLGQISGDFVSQITGGLYKAPWPVQLNKRIVEGGYDTIFSVGQVVPHEVVGMANHAKNLFVGCGGVEAIDSSHFIGAVYGMERMMGRTSTPVRELFSKALTDYCSHLNIVFILTVVGPAKEGEIGDSHGLVTRGLFVGTGFDCFEQAAKLSMEVNFQMLDRQPAKIVVNLDPHDYHTTWLGNKAIYRTRMAIADGGELIILAPGVKGFGEDEAVDALIRKYGYRTTPEILYAVEQNADLRANLSAAAHLIHGSSENRFGITYAPGGLSRGEIEHVGYKYADVTPLLEKYNPATLMDGWNVVEGEEIFFVRHPALVLLAHASRFSRDQVFKEQGTLGNDGSRKPIVSPTLTVVRPFDANA